MSAGKFCPYEVVKESRLTLRVTVESEDGRTGLVDLEISLPVPAVFHRGYDPLTGVPILVIPAGTPLVKTIHCDTWLRKRSGTTLERVRERMFG